MHENNPRLKNRHFWKNNDLVYLKGQHVKDLIQRTATRSGGAQFGRPQFSQEAYNLEVHNLEDQNQEVYNFEDQNQEAHYLEDHNL